MTSTAFARVETYKAIDSSNVIDLCVTEIRIDTSKDLGEEVLKAMVGQGKVRKIGKEGSQSMYLTMWPNTSVYKYGIFEKAIVTRTNSSEFSLQREYLNDYGSAELAEEGPCQNLTFRRLK
jgi:hypothetical protein